MENPEHKKIVEEIQNQVRNAEQNAANFHQSVLNRAFSGSMYAGVGIGLLRGAEIFDPSHNLLKHTIDLTLMDLSTFRAEDVVTAGLVIFGSVAIPLGAVHLVDSAISYAHSLEFRRRATQLNIVLAKNRLAQDD